MSFILYKIYYGDELVYLGRTKQKLQDRLHGHFFKKPYHRVINLLRVTKLEYAEFQSEADMFLYEIYYINKLKPLLNCDDCAKDELSVTLPEAEFRPFECSKIDQWKDQIKESSSEFEYLSQELQSLQQNLSVLRKQRRDGLIDEDAYWEQKENMTERIETIKKGIYGR